MNIIRTEQRVLTVSGRQLTLGDLRRFLAVADEQGFPDDALLSDGTLPLQELTAQHGRSQALK